MDKPEPLKQITNVKTGSDEPGNIQDCIIDIHHKFGTSDKANYEIQKLFESTLSARVKELESSQRERAVGFHEWMGLQSDYDINRLNWNQLYDKYIEYLNTKA
jgi:hypothetical protein